MIRNNSGIKREDITMKKTISFAGLHFTVAFTVAYLLTGDLLIGSLIAMIEPMVNTVAFYFHEKAWQTKLLKKSHYSAPASKTISFAVVHFTVAFIVVYLLTGDALIGGMMAMIEPAINTVIYYFHERVWQRKEQQADDHNLLNMMVCQH
jgi:uncharacterized membrane protein